MEFYVLSAKMFPAAVNLSFSICNPSGLMHPVIAVESVKATIIIQLGLFVPEVKMGAERAPACCALASCPPLFIL